MFLGILALVAALSTAHATLYTETFTVGSAIPDGNRVGISFNGTVSDTGGSSVSSLSVTLNITGGFNGDLYSYLVAPNGTMVVLLNQPGVTGTDPFGNSGSGMHITLADGGLTITASSDLSSGTYAAAGALSGFNGSTADGTWTLYFADLSSGGGTSVLNSWQLNITAVPEPVNIALAAFTVLGIAMVSFRALKRSTV